jgi:hypothetical protein
MLEATPIAVGGCMRTATHHLLDGWFVLVETLAGVPAKKASQQDAKRKE